MATTQYGTRGSTLAAADSRQLTAFSSKKLPLTETVDRLTSFQKLALWTTGVTYLLILVGGLVRASGAGLGCPDWPRCFVSWIPPASAAQLPTGFDASQFNETLM